MIHESYILFGEKFKLSGRASGLWISQKEKEEEEDDDENEVWHQTQMMCTLT